MRTLMPDWVRPMRSPAAVNPRASATATKQRNRSESRSIRGMAIHDHLSWMIYQQFVSVIYARSPHSIRERMETIHGNRPITIPDRAAPDPGTVRFLRGKGQGRTGEGNCGIRPAARVGGVAHRPLPGPTPLPARHDPAGPARLLTR